MNTIDLAIYISKKILDGDFQTLKILSYIKINFNVSDYDMRSPLHVAGDQDDKDIFEFLIKCGADKDSKDRNGNVPELNSERDF